MDGYGFKIRKVSRCRTALSNETILATRQKFFFTKVAPVQSITDIALWKAVTDLCAKQMRSTIVFMCSFHLFMCSFHSVMRSFHLVMRSFHLVMCSFHSVIYSFHYSLFSCALFMRSLYSLFLCALFMRSLYLLSLCAVFMRSFYVFF